MTFLVTELPNAQPVVLNMILLKPKKHILMREMKNTDFANANCWGDRLRTHKDGACGYNNLKTVTPV